MPTVSVANEAQWRLHVKCQFGIDVIAVIYTRAVTAELLGLTLHRWRFRFLTFTHALSCKTPMSALGQKRTFRCGQPMSALALKKTAHLNSITERDRSVIFCRRKPSK